MKTELVTDLPMGILMIVVSQFFLLGVYNLMQLNQWYSFVGVVFGSVFYWKLFNVGLRVAFFGIEVEKEESNDSGK